MGKHSQYSDSYLPNLLTFDKSNDEELEKMTKKALNSPTLYIFKSKPNDVLENTLQPNISSEPEQE